MQDSEKILSRFPGPVRLSPSRLLVAGVLLILIVLVTFLIFYVSGKLGSTRPHGAYDTFMSWFSLVVLAGVAVISLVQLLRPNTICLILDADGFEIHRFVKSERVRWRDVRGFSIRKQLLARGTIEQVRFETVNGGGVLPINYGLGLQDLLRLMEAWRKQATAGERGAASGKTAHSSR